MPADSIPAAHSAQTEMSAHPVSKSSFKKESTLSHVHPKEASYSPRRGAIRLEPAMSVMGVGRDKAAFVVKDMEIGQPINSEKVFRNCRWRRTQKQMREVLSESRMREICMSGSMSGM